MTNVKKNKVLLIIPYLEKAPGVRHLANYLSKNGFPTTIIFVKELQALYSSKPITKEELMLLKQLIEQEDYLFVGLSLHTSLIINEIKPLIDFLHNDINKTFVSGGFWASSSPKECAEYCDIVIRGEGEKVILKLARALQNNEYWGNIPNLSYYNKKNEYIENELEPLTENLDIVAYPKIGGDMYLIDNNQIIKGDPQLSIAFYETSASRGCPFSCSFCCSSNMRKIYKGKGEYLRFRSVNNVISELLEAKKKNPHIKIIRFWDEVFSNDKKWISEFCKAYKREIGIPFHIWGHPAMVKKDIIGMLKSAGLRRIVVGFQSGSPNVRNKIFNRPETNEQIIEASKIIAYHKIPEVYYDLMICHPLETLEELKETFDLCLKLEPPFVYELHQLAIQPGAEIAKNILEKGIYSEEDLGKIFCASFEEQNSKFLEPVNSSYVQQPEKKVWADLIYLTQFYEIRNQVIKLAKDPYKNEEKINTLKEHIQAENMKSHDKYSFVSEMTISFDSKSKGKVCNFLRKYWPRFFRGR